MSLSKRVPALVLAATLVLSAAPALAGKKKPKPYKSEEVTLLVPHPVLYSTTGSVNSITAKEFENTCSIPSTNGLDAYVFEVPKEYQSLQAQFEAIGSSAGAAGYDLDAYLYNADCKHTIAFNQAGTDEMGVLPKGTAYVVVHNYLGDPAVTAHIEIKA